MSSNIGERIRELRQKNSLTMDDLAKRVGYNSRASISRVEHGETDLPLSKVKEFADALNTTPAYLLGWTDDPQDSAWDSPRERVSEWKKDNPAPAETLEDVYLNFAKEAQADGIDPDDIRAVLDILKKAQRK